MARHRAQAGVVTAGGKGGEHIELEEARCQWPTVARDQGGYQEVEQTDTCGRGALPDKGLCVRLCDGCNQRDGLHLQRGSYLLPYEHVFQRNPDVPAELRY